MTHDRDPAGTGHDPTPDSPPHEPARGREPMFNLPAVVVAFIVACVGIHLVRVWLLSPQQDLGLILRFAFFPLRYSGGYTLDVYAFLAPFTYSLLHGGLAHLAVNTIWLAAFGSPLANRQMHYFDIVIRDPADSDRILASRSFRSRGGCCRYYTSREGKLCTTCVLLDPADRDRNLEAKLRFRLGLAPASTPTPRHTA